MAISDFFDGLSDIGTGLTGTADKVLSGLDPVIQKLGAIAGSNIANDTAQIKTETASPDPADVVKKDSIIMYGAIAIGLLAAVMLLKK